MIHVTDNHQCCTHCDQEKDAHAPHTGLSCRLPPSVESRDEGKEFMKSVERIRRESHQESKVYHCSDEAFRDKKCPHSPIGWREKFSGYKYEDGGTWTLNEVKSLIAQFEAEAMERQLKITNAELPKIIAAAEERGRNAVIKIAESMQPILWNDDPTKHLRNISRAETLKELMEAARSTKGI